MIRTFWRQLPEIVSFSALLALLSSLAAAWSLLTEGYPLLALEVFRNHLALALGVGGCFLVVAVALRPLAAKWLPPRLALPAVTALAMGPWIAYFGYRINLYRGIRPSQLLDSYALEVNLLYLLGCGLVWVVLVALRSRPVSPTTGRVWLLASLMVLLLVIHGALTFAFAPREQPHEMPNVLVLLIDALRADHLSGYGYGRETSPSLDALAADGVTFRHTIAQSTFTKSSIASLFTGRNVFQHGVYWGSQRETPESITSDLLGLEENTLAERLREGGYYTTAWVQNSHLRGFMGFSQGFVSYRDQQGSIEKINGRFRHWLGNGAQRYPWMAYLHYIDLHDPYLPKPPYDTLFGSYTEVYKGLDLANWGTYLEAVRNGEEVPTELEVEQYRVLYDGLIRMVDDKIGRLLEELKTAGLYDRTLIVVTSDHGDAFMEHGFISHSTTPYDELVKVPLIVKFPDSRHRGQTIEEQVRLIDVLPTVLDVVGIEGDATIAGCGLVDLLTTPGKPRPPGCVFAFSEIAETGAYPTVAVRTKEKKLIHFEKANDQLFDLLDDPGEHRPIEPTEEDDLHLESMAFQVVADRALKDQEQIELDEQQIRELKALGYID